MKALAQICVNSHSLTNSIPQKASQNSLTWIIKITSMKNVHLNLRFCLPMILLLCSIGIHVYAAPADSTFQRNYKLGFKTNPLQLLSGNFPVLFEYRFAKPLSFEVGLGMTSFDALYELGRAASGNTGPITVRPDLGYSGSLALRYYFSDFNAPMTGGYFSPQIEHRYFSNICSTCQQWNTNGQQLFLQETRRQTYFRILIGYQTIGFSNFLLDFYGGLGLRYRDAYVVTCSTEPGTGSVPIITHRQGVAPTVSMGFKLGFAK